MAGLATAGIVVALLLLDLIRSITRATSVDGIFALDKSATKSIWSSVSCAFDGPSSTMVTGEPIGWPCASCAKLEPLGGATDGGARMIGDCFSGIVLYLAVDGLEADGLFSIGAGVPIGLAGSEL
jgi:hypothetical protein